MLALLPLGCVLYSHGCPSYSVYNLAYADYNLLLLTAIGYLTPISKNCAH